MCGAHMCCSYSRVWPLPQYVFLVLVCLVSFRSNELVCIISDVVLYQLVAEPLYISVLIADSAFGFFNQMKETMSANSVCIAASSRRHGEVV
ncbi:hypothetical protein COP2_014057 [Malus domestica]